MSCATKQVTGGCTYEEKTSDGGDWLVVSLGAGWVLLWGQAPEKDSDPVKLTPHMYQVRLENAYVRVRR